VAEGFGDTITRGIRRAANAIIPGAEKDAGDYGAGKWDKNTNTNRNNLIDWITLNQLDYYEDEVLGYFDKFVDGGGSESKAGQQAVETWKTRMKRDGESVRKPEDMAEGDNMSTFVEDAELAEMLKYAGVPVKESVLTDSTGSTLDHIQNTFKRDVKDFTQTGDMSDALYDALYDYYFDDMPYGTKKARDGDPHEWISDRFAQDIGLDEGWKGALAGGLAGAGLGSVVPGLGTLAGGIAGAYAGHKIGDQGISDPTPAPAKPGAAAPQRNAPIKMTAADRLAMPSGPRKASFQKTVTEGSCNMTMEGDYCPEHGLAECGGMYEGTDDPINSNSAMTGSYYEGKETDIQEGDALLARIKSLALLR
jgi:hypothetical protein